MVRKKVCIVVLGDIGRSPRMQYHANSLAKEGHVVDIVGYRGAPPINSLETQPLVSFHYLNPYPNIPFPRILNYIFKTIWQMINLFFVLCIIRTPDIILVQNPPAVPTLLVTYIYKKVSGCKLIIDWHNYAYTIMALNVGATNVLVKITKFIESFVGSRADYNFCVTNGMREDLKINWKIEATTLYDRPPDMFKPITVEEKHSLFVKLGKRYNVLAASTEMESLFTQVKNEEVTLKDERPGLIVSSTSWTEDEDFSELLTALVDYEIVKNSGKINLPKLVCIITGKGPLKEYYCKKIKKIDFKHIVILTPWLETEEYPLLLASADLGVSLHTSSSGLDLPMKVVDMFGCGIPVCAYNFKCLDELVKHNKNGFVFKTAKELSSQIQNWFQNFPLNKDQETKLKAFQENLKAFQSLKWHENWKNNVALIFK